MQIINLVTLASICPSIFSISCSALLIAFSSLIFCLALSEKKKTSTLFYAVGNLSIKPKFLLITYLCYL